ncbi:tetratricopeptide repeat protein [Azomonas macrocytogenes]|uniref:Lipoprotein n=1 Tax=Azomonas macrocytogenes TaxID=69962 RepID=A0A839T1Q6_AZOMA|nr:hypothetical protein [Azomonas macrocytogenes]MBB3101683.1 hypothetical protein [Azomonas macrocytogenes]
MRTLIVLILALSCGACSSRGAADRYMDSAYEAYAANDCLGTLLALSQAERQRRVGSSMQPEISLLRGNCLERQGLFVDAAQTYLFIQSRYPSSEYAFRAKARLETLRQLGHYRVGDTVAIYPAKP